MRRVDEPIAAAMERRHERRVRVAAVYAIDAVHFQVHAVLAYGVQAAILAPLPHEVVLLEVLEQAPVVDEYGAVARPRDHLVAEPAVVVLLLFVVVVASGRLVRLVLSIAFGEYVEDLLVRVPLIEAHERQRQRVNDLDRCCFGCCWCWFACHIALDSTRLEEEELSVARRLALRSIARAGGRSS